MITVMLSFRNGLITVAGYAGGGSQTTERGKPMKLPDSQASTHPENPSHLYRSYLVRLWRSHAQAPLRASAQCVQTGVTTHFASLESLFSFLETHGVTLATPDEDR